MPALQVTVTALGAAPFNIGWLLVGQKPDGSVYAPAGVTVQGQNAKNFTNVQFARITHDPASTATNLYIGDSDCGAAHHGDTIALKDYRQYWPTMGNTVHLAEKYFTFDVVGATSGIMTLDYEVY